MLTLNWLKDEENVVYGREAQIVPELSRDLMIPDLMEQIERFRQVFPAADQERKQCCEKERKSCAGSHF